MRWLIVMSVAASIWCVPAVVRAGGCPACETSKDCPDGFCVVWDEGHGCQSVNPICCPGQGCAIGEDQRPSCEADGLCCVVEDPQCTIPADTSSGTDASSGDASADDSTDASASNGTADGDGSSGASADASASATDASATDATAADSGDGTADGGGDASDTAADEDDEGCGCTSAPNEDRFGWMLAALAGVLATRRRQT
jgi:MYXO-CTERM domain-containing protein